MNRMDRAELMGKRAAINEILAKILLSADHQERLETELAEITAALEGGAR